jgi:ABC transporter with metal-binding/Fe-S-binding domain ATP-binding protein
MRAAVAYSGGKDSTRAVYECIKAGDEVCCLLNVIPDTAESYLFHYPNARWTKLQAEAMNLPLLSREVRGVNEAEEFNTFTKLLAEAVVKYSVNCLYTGAVASQYQRRRFEEAASKLGLKCINPLWGMSGEQILRDLLRLGFKTIIVGVSAAGLGPEWLGRVIDEAAIDDLKRVSRRYGVNLSFEGGEAETFVLDAPMFTKSIEITSSEIRWDGYVGFYVIKDARLAEKRCVKEVG